MKDEDDGNSSSSSTTTTTETESTKPKLKKKRDPKVMEQERRKLIPLRSQRKPPTTRGRLPGKTIDTRESRMHLVRAIDTEVTVFTDYLFEIIYLIRFIHSRQDMLRTY